MQNITNEIGCINVPFTLERTGKTPEYTDDEAAGLDLFINLESFENNDDLEVVSQNNHDVYLHPDQRAIVSVGVSFSIPKGYYGKIFDRSGLAGKKGLLTMGGVIDSNYRGVVKIILLNTGIASVTLQQHMKIAQIIFHKYERANLIPVDSLEETSRGNNGFGSTGV